MNIDFELHLCTISNPRPGLTPGTALRAVGSGIIFFYLYNILQYYTGSQKELIMTVFLLPGSRWKSAKKVLHKRTFSHAKNESSVVLHM